MITKPSRIVIKTQLFDTPDQSSVYIRGDLKLQSPLMKTLDWSVETSGFVIIYLNQSSERNMIDIPAGSERTNFKHFLIKIWKMGCNSVEL
jgi:hypothetical protein